jgi:alcohol dehydrogenase class IV
VLGAKGETIARAFGGRTAAEAMAKLRRRLGLDLSLDGYVRTDADRERLAEWAMKSGQVKMNPRAATLEDMRAILAAMRTPTGDAAPVVGI